MSFDDKFRIINRRNKVNVKFPRCFLSPYWKCINLKAARQCWSDHVISHLWESGRRLWRLVSRHFIYFNFRSA